MHNTLQQRLVGCFYTIFTPFDAVENIDYDALANYIETLHSQGARRFYAMAYNSRYSQLSESEILELNAFCIRTVKDLDKDSVIVVGDPIHGSTKQSLEFTKHAEDCGADLISLLFREKYFDDEQVLDHYSYIGNRSKLPILVHEMPFLSGSDGTQMHWPISLLKALKKVPQIAALKEDAKDFDVTRAALELEPDIRVVIAGRKSEFIKFLPYGAKAYLNGISIIDARIGEYFWTACERDDETAIQYVLEELEAPFFEECVSAFGWHRCNKAILQSANFMDRRDRMPLKHLDEDEYEKVKTTFESIKSNLGKIT